MPNQISGLLTRIAIFTCLVTISAGNLLAQPTDSEKKVTNPVYRVGNNKTDTGFAKSSTPVKLAPIDKALLIANDGLTHIRSDIKDYSATMIKRERINGAVTDPEYMSIKIRNRNEAEGIPLSIYMKFLKPSKIKGREVIYVEGQNDGKLIAHEGGAILGRITAKLDPDGSMAMRGNRYPIYEAGIENLVFRLIEKGTRDKELGGSEVKFYEKTKINGRECTLIQVMHPEKRPEYDFYICRVFIDKEYNVPIRYAAYGWPLKEGGKPTLEEEYTYLNMKMNIGLTDEDFDHTNAEYNFK